MLEFAQKQAKATATFFKELVLNSAMNFGEPQQETKAPADSNNDSGVTFMVNPFHKRLRKGQIRCLPGTKRVTYIALIGKWDDDNYLCMTFSPFSSPANHLEMRADRDGGLFQRVLQVWNTRTLGKSVLEKSWAVGTLPKQDLQDAWDLWRMDMTGGTVVDFRLLAKTGSPFNKERLPEKFVELYSEYSKSELLNMRKVETEDESEYFGEE